MLLQVLLIILFILLALCIFNRRNLESFIVTIEETILPKQCPDYLVTDGQYYYLVFNNKVFDGVNNPLIFKDIADVKQLLERIECPMLDIISLRRETMNTDIWDPWDNYERLCSKQIARPLQSLESCAFDIAYQNPGNDGKPKLILPEDIANMSDAEIKRTIKTAKTTDSEKIKILRRLNDFLANAGDSVMVDYDLETCMIDKLGSDKGELGGSYLGNKRILQQFNKHYNDTLDNKYNINDDNNILDDGALKEFDKYFKSANDLPLHQGMYQKLFPKDIDDK
jgi:hypothetical protein